LVSDRKYHQWYGLEVSCPLKQRDVISLDFVVTDCSFMKLFQTYDINVVKVYQDLSKVKVPSTSTTSI